MSEQKKKSGKRNRLRPDWPRAVYKFDISPVGEIPQALWDTAKSMQALWNRLVALHDAVLSATKDLEKSEKAGPYKQFWKAVYDTTRAADDLNGYCKNEVYDRFQASVRRFYNKTGNKPKSQNGLRRICIPHTNRDGGWSVDWLDSENTRKALRIKAAPEGAYLDNSRASRRARSSRGYFRIGNDSLLFLINIHRPIPPGSMVKKVCIVGKFIKTLGWSWSLDVNIEYLPKTHTHTASTGRFAALDIGWRKFDDYLRIGVLADSGGNMFEIRLPFDLSNRSTRRLNGFVADKGSDYRTVDDFRGLEELQSERDNVLEDAKFKLSTRVAELPAELRPNKNSLRLMRQGGLVRLMRALKEQGAATEIQTILFDWLGKDRAFARRIESARKRMIARRNWLYRNIAAWLAERYDSLLLEGDFDLSVVASEDEQGEAVKAAQRYRQMAGLYQFRGAINNAFSKAGREVKGMPAAYSTQTCALCGGHIDSGPALVLTCENGHSQDQDINTAKLFLVEAGIDLRSLARNPTTPDLSQFAGSVVVLREPLVATLSRGFRG